jgi:ABC-2 type transport system ATP-binding protein
MPPWLCEARSFAGRDGFDSATSNSSVVGSEAIAADPSLVLLDEPTDGLDPVQRDEMLALIRQISAEYSIDVVLSSHLLEEVERICDNIVALDAGRLVVQGDLESLVGDTQTIMLELVDITDRPGAIDGVERRLTAAGLDVQRDLGRFRITGPDPQATLDLARDAVAAESARLRRLETGRRTLEDLFTKVDA